MTHSRNVDNKYEVHYPDHAPRDGDPHYHAFEAFRKAHKDTATCWIGSHIPGECEGELELHHHFLEFAVINAVDLDAIQKDFPNLTDPEKVAEWAESDQNFMWLCAKHHRSPVGAHRAAFADFEASAYVKGLLSEDGS